MRRNKVALLFLLCMGLLSVLTAIKPASAAHSGKSLLIMNSYHDGLSWTRDQVDGATTYLEENGVTLNISVEFLDWKRYPDEQLVSVQYQYLREKYRQTHFDMVYCTDDAALTFALKHRMDWLGDVPVIFSGVNQVGAARITAGQENVYGVIEEIDPAGTYTMMKTLIPDLRQVVVLSDSTESGRSTGALVKATLLADQPDLKVEIPYDEDFDAVMARISKLPPDCAVLSTTWLPKVHGTTVDFETISRMVCQASSVPVFDLYTFGYGRGSIGGSLISSRLQGTKAGEIIESLSGGVPPVPAFREGNASRMKVLDWSVMQKYGLKIPEGTRGITVVNQPPSFLDKYHDVIFRVLGVLLLLLVFIVILSFMLIRLRRINQRLDQKVIEEAALYDQLAAAEEELRQQHLLVMDQALHDELTGLPNRRALLQYEGFRSGMAAFFYMDLDNFKNANDTLGHQFGDRVLRAVAERIRGFLPDHAFLARLGGDEFVAIVNVRNRAEAVTWGQQLIDVFERPMIQDIVTHEAAASAGAALFPEDGRNIQELLRKGDVALYRAKEEGRGRCMFYSPEMDEDFSERLSLESDLRQAMARNEFSLVYQPQVDASSGKLRGFEALIRWKRQGVAFCSPDKFIPVAEEAQLIVPIGEWVLKEACRFAAESVTRGEEVTISVNVSMIQLQDERFPETVFEYLNAFGLPAGAIELEITESIMMDNYESVAQTIQAIHDMGIPLALDDFGKGHSSLSRLTSLPLKKLKVDKSFIDLIGNPEKEVLPASIILLGKQLGMTVVAEGVETEAQHRFLRSLDCDLIQGYYFSKPLSAGDAAKWRKM